jgi:hypothetical protein
VLPSVLLCRSAASSPALKDGASAGVPGENIDGGQVFRQAWIDEVRAHYPGDPKPGYVAP